MLREKPEAGRNLLSPVTFLTKICMVGVDSGLAEREEGGEEGILSVLSTSGSRGPGPCRVGNQRAATTAYGRRTTDDGRQSSQTVARELTRTRRQEGHERHDDEARWDWKIGRRYSICAGGGVRRCRRWLRKSSGATGTAQAGQTRQMLQHGKLRGNDVTPGMSRSGRGRRSGSLAPAAALQARCATLPGFWSGWPGRPAPASAGQRQPAPAKRQRTGRRKQQCLCCTTTPYGTYCTVQYSTVGSLQAAKHGARPKRRGAAAGHNHGHGHGHGHDEVQVDPDGAHHVAKRSAAGVDRPRSQRSAAPRRVWPWVCRRFAVSLAGAGSGSGLVRGHRRLARLRVRLACVAMQLAELWMMPRATGRFGELPSR